MSSHGYEELDHAADLALRVWGEDFGVLLNQAVQGMTALMGIRFDPSHPVEASLSLPNGSQEEMLVDFLGEVLFVMEEKDLVLVKFDVLNHLPFVMKGTFYPIISVGRWIKAVTFHNLVITQSNDQVETTITFDV